jgi:hypothetical protein
MRSTGLLSAVAVLLAACAGLRSGPGTQPPENVLLLGSSSGVVSIDPGTGSVLFDGAGVAALGDWSTVFTASMGGGTTSLEAVESATGEVLSTVPITGNLDIRVASSDGSQVALMAPLPEGGSPWIPEPRAWTKIVVADPTGARDPKTYRLRGNLEPEAFSTDDRGLFLIRYVPPTAPTGYRVARLDLADGEVHQVATGAKGIVETMSGTRLEQVGSPDGTMLYTLYTTQPPEYAEARHQDGRPIAFVHTLSLDEGWAHCIGLPEELWGGDPADQAVALSPDGRLLYVVDTARDILAVMDTSKHASVAHHLDFDPSGGDAQAAVGPDGTLFVATGTRVASFDPTTLTAGPTWTTGDQVAALGPVPEGLAVAMPGRVTVFEPSTGRHVRAIPSPAVEDLTYVGLLEP